MGVLNKGTDFSNGDQITDTSLDNLVDNATFTTSAVDEVSTDIGGTGAIIVKDEGITTGKLANSTGAGDGVTTAKLATAAVTTAKLATAAVTEAKLAAAAVTEAKIGTDAVTTVKIQNAAVTEDKLGAASVTASKLATGALNDATVIADGSTEARDLPERFADTVNVKDFGAIGDGVTDDTAAFQAAATAAGAGNPIYVPSGNYLKSSITNESDYFWICGEALDSAGVNPITLLGHVEQSFANRRFIQKTTATAGEYAELQLSKTFDYVGGTGGNVASGMVLSTSVSSGVEDFVWNLTSVLNNSADAGENVAIYGQGNRDAGIGPVWAGVFEAKDKTNTSGAGKGGLVGIEVDVFANGTDDASNRIGIDVVVGKGVGGGSACSATYGIKIGPQNDTIANGTFNVGYSAIGCVSADYLSQSESSSGFQASGVNTFGVLLNGTHTVGIDLSQATIANQAIRLAAGQQIAFDATGAVTVEFDSGSNAILFKNSGVTKHTFSMA